MKQTKCQQCCFGDKCKSPYICSYYSPVDGVSDEDIDKIIKADKRDFLKEWFQYAKEYDD